MLRTAATISSTTNAGHRPPVAPVRAARKLVIVNGSTESAAMVEATLDGGRYDMVFVASNAQAYSQIKQEQPNLVVLCLQSDHVEGYQVLSMLKLDEATRRIPVVTVSTEDQGDGDVSRIIQDDERDTEEAPEGFFAPRGPIVMN
jgi:CheY-like chemotaxis protein